MPSSLLTLPDRLRIERTVWVLDARLGDLPRAARIARRRELRQNLHEAAAEVGARQAVRSLGDLRVLAADYLAAEYDSAPRPSWTATAVWILLAEAAMLLVDSVAESAFRGGVSAVSPHATGTFHWSGLRFVIEPATYQYAGGHATSDGGAWAPLVYVIMLGGAVVAGRLWRLVPALRRRPVEAGAER